MAVDKSTRERLDQLFKQRIVIFDGSMGVMLQHRGLSDEEFRGERFRLHPKPLRNNSDVLCLTQPDLVTQVHLDYLEAGADIITTNTFTATRVSQADYGLEDLAYEMNLEGARLARKAADAYENRFVAGSLGPTNVTLSLSPRVDDPSYRDVTFDQLKDGYAEAAHALREGGADFLLIETIFDTLNGKAAIAAVKEAAPDLPLFVSVTIVDRSGRNLSGQTVEAFWTSVEHAQPFAAGINCSLGALEMRPYIAALSRVAPVYVHCYPNAGLPNAFGGYDEEPPTTSRLLKEFAEAGFLNAAGDAAARDLSTSGRSARRWKASRRARFPGASPGRASAASSRSRSPRTRASWWSASGPTSPARSASGASSRAATSRARCRSLWNRCGAAPTSSTSTWTPTSSTRRRR